MRLGPSDDCPKNARGRKEKSIIVIILVIIAETPSTAQRNSRDGVPPPGLPTRLITATWGIIIILICTEYEGHPVREPLGSPCREMREQIQAVNHRFSKGLVSRIQTQTSLHGALHEETLEVCILQCATIRRLTACALSALAARLKYRIGL